MQPSLGSVHLLLILLSPGELFWEATHLLSHTHQKVTCTSILLSFLKQLGLIHVLNKAQKAKDKLGTLSKEFWVDQISFASIQK